MVAEPGVICVGSFNQSMIMHSHMSVHNTARPWLVKRLGGIIYVVHCWTATITSGD